MLQPKRYRMTPIKRKEAANQASAEILTQVGADSALSGLWAELGAGAAYIMRGAWHLGRPKIGGMFELLFYVSSVHYFVKHVIDFLESVLDIEGIGHILQLLPFPPGSFARNIGMVLVMFMRISPIKAPHRVDIYGRWTQQTQQHDLTRDPATSTR